MADDPPPPLKTDPKYGWYPWWPEDGDAWVHPEDVTTARATIPSPRVWRRDGQVAAAEGPYVVLHYGETRLRVHRTLWRETPHEGLNIGDWVEVRSRGMANEPLVGRVREMLWDTHAGALVYELELPDGANPDRRYSIADLKPVEPPTARAEVRRPATPDSGEDLDVLEP